VYTHAFQRYGRLSFSKWPQSAILELIQPEMAPFDPIPVHYSDGRYSDS